MAQPQADEWYSLLRLLTRIDFRAFQDDVRTYKLYEDLVNGRFPMQLYMDIYDTKWITTNRFLKRLNATQFRFFRCIKYRNRLPFDALRTLTFLRKELPVGPDAVNIVFSYSLEVVEPVFSMAQRFIRDWRICFEAALTPRALRLTWQERAWTRPDHTRKRKRRRAICVVKRSSPQA